MVVLAVVSIRDVDARVFREFKAETVREGVKLGAAVTHALRHWLRFRHRVERKGRFLDLKPVDWGSGTERSSQEVDQTLYG